MQVLCQISSGFRVIQVRALRKKLILTVRISQSRERRVVSEEIKVASSVTLSPPLHSATTSHQLSQIQKIRTSLNIRPHPQMKLLSLNLPNLWKCDYSIETKIRSWLKMQPKSMKHMKFLQISHSALNRKEWVSCSGIKILVDWFSIWRVLKLSWRARLDQIRESSSTKVVTILRLRVLERLLFLKNCLLKSSMMVGTNAMTPQRQTLTTEKN